ncbi:MAG: noncanonical pyrimidine nucleotidase, YjjG family [Flavobacteriales bacterium CG_4_10_14_0_2_um_filter_32_8]|nr:MAG: noncanonical pyrimidine nucleotidase, YjjG family [Flavobacteriales bacterium CG_4_10_14_0_2_um_filter_32_8]PJB14974.1 MAG: noncanonical pyrimidine nucleotidase, YjjG family [Flavobacteriales bacterium CG_4_9_14_3_um_filter_32_8]
MLKKYEHIFFDLDRTLWHFDENSKKVLKEIFTIFKLNQSIDSFDSFLEKYHEINNQLWDAYEKDKIGKEKLRWKRFEDTLQFFKIDNQELSTQIGDYYIDWSPKQTLLFPHAIETLEYLSKKYQLHIISNGFEEVQHIKLTNSGIIHYFSTIILSERVGVKKPHPLIFKRAMKQSGASIKNSIMIGDDLYADIYGAQRVKMDHVYFNFYKTVHDKKVQYEINCLSELVKFL